MSTRVVPGTSGASGAPLALDCARHLARLGVAVDLVAPHLARQACEPKPGPEATGELESLADVIHETSHMGTTIASGSYTVAGMIVPPCSMCSLAATANGLDDTLLTRVAGVQLKERPLAHAWQG